MKSRFHPSAMQVKGAGERTVRAAKTLEDIKLKTQNSRKKNEELSPILNNSTTAQNTIKILATPRNTIPGAHNRDIDDLLAQGRAAADATVDTKVISSGLDTSQAPSSEATNLIGSIEYEKYTVDDIDEWLVLVSLEAELLST